MQVKGEQQQQPQQNEVFFFVECVFDLTIERVFSLN